MNAARYRFLLVAGLLVLFAHCRSSSGKRSADIPAERLYFNISIDGRDDEENITLKVQCQDVESDGEGVMPGEDFGVWLDGRPFQSDSSRFYGHYYELQVPLDSFSGSHVIDLRRGERSVHKESFAFLPLELAVPVADTLFAGDFRLRLTGLPEGEPVRLVMSDTSFSSDGFNELLVASSGLLQVSGDQLRTLSPGPLQVELIREWERPLEDPAGAGGLFRLFYTVRRNFVLVK